MELVDSSDLYGRKPSFGCCLYRSHHAYHFNDGIIIRMYFAPKEHPPPHFHVYYNEYKATVDIRTCEIIEGDLPGRQTRLVLAWAELHQEDLMADWRLVSNGEEPFKIQPLQ